MANKVKLPKYLKRLKRGPAVILPKDAGYIVARLNINKKDVVLECGGGSGFLTVLLAGICDKVFSVEKSEAFCEVIRHNVKIMNYKNVEVINQDFFSSDVLPIFKKVSVLILDMKEVCKAVSYAWPHLSGNCRIALYLPNIEQAKEAFLLLKSLGVGEMEMCELFKREYIVREKGTRPSHHDLTHTAFLVFAKKNKK